MEKNIGDYTLQEVQQLCAARKDCNGCTFQKMTPDGPVCRIGVRNNPERFDLSPAEPKFSAAEKKMLQFLLYHGINYLARNQYSEELYWFGCQPVRITGTWLPVVPTHPKGVLPKTMFPQIKSTAEAPFDVFLNTRKIIEDAK